jgi:predicted nucleotidyltransferase
MPFRNEEFISKKITQFIERFVSKYEAIIEIWLFGSRAMGQKGAKDWDLLVVAMDQGATLGLAEKDLTLKDEAERLGIHLFIHGKDKDPLGYYYCPWERTVSKVRDKFNLREKISWPEQFWFQYSGERGEKIGRCVWDREGGKDSFLNSHFYI